MDAQLIITLISNVGFPIVVCIAMYKYITTTIKDLQQVIDANTAILNKLYGAIVKDKDGDLIDE